MSTLYYESSLSHHGIHGQKCGKRNGPPYPLGSGKGSRRSSAKQKKLESNSKSASKKRNKASAVKNYLTTGNQKLSSKQKKVLTAATVASGALFVAGIAMSTKASSMQSAAFKTQMEMLVKSMRSNPLLF